MAEGRSTRRSPRALVVTEGAVEKHICSIFAKLGLGRRPRTIGGCSPYSPTWAVDRLTPKKIWGVDYLTSTNSCGDSALRVLLVPGALTRK